LIDNKIPVHCFYVAKNAKTNFEEISGKNKGSCEFLDINSAAGATLLTDVVTKEILRQAGELAGNGKGEECIAIYNKKYVKGYID
jgi:hypothetical protein